MIVMVTVALPTFSAVPALLGAAAAATGGLEGMDATLAAGGTEASSLFMMLILLWYCTIGGRNFPFVNLLLLWIRTGF